MASAQARRPFSTTELRIGIVMEEAELRERCMAMENTYILTVLYCMLTTGEKLTV